MVILTDNTKFKIQGRDYTCKDLREFETMYQGDEAYYGSKRAILLTADGQGDRQSWDNAIELQNGELVYIDGAPMYVVVTEIDACNGVKFITKETYDAIRRII